MWAPTVQVVAQSARHGYVNRLGEPVQEPAARETAKASEADGEKLHAKIGQLLVDTAARASLTFLLAWRYPIRNMEFCIVALA